MAATQHQIKEWLAQAVEKGASHMLTVCDGFDHEDYPVFVIPPQDVNKTVASFNADSMQCVMEVYNMNIDLNEQLHARRVMNY